ncbi:nitroreductase family protein [uncultured Methanobrevibacter sp.]|uniref:nitroreductase family protein n=1 Tax=uncultured Methanobrevibacter sp. TaxID=253161 RepID=UPI00260AB619|nr:nitroreductase family protein [uncultured Methanobrevibacter sp.]
MNLEDTIYKRQSIRKYDNTPLSEETLDELRDFIDNAKVLNPGIAWSYDIAGPENFRMLQRFKAPHALLLFSQTKENYLQNIGFIFQQVDLYLQSRGIGSCWIGAGGPKNHENPNPDHEFVIMMIFGKPQGRIYRESTEFQRKIICEISDERDSKLIPARLAPSAANSQTWYFTHNDDGSYNLYRNRRKFNLNRKMDTWNQVDMGIVLAHLYVANPDTFEFTRDKPHEELKNKVFEGSFTI